MTEFTSWRDGCFFFNERGYNRSFAAGRNSQISLCAIGRGITRREDWRGVEPRSGFRFFLDEVEPKDDKINTYLKTGLGLIVVRFLSPSVGNRRRRRG